MDKKNILDLIELDKCTGCRACECICPHNAIVLTSNEEGFIYPQVNKSKCAYCSLCIKTCHALKKYSVRPIESNKAYYSWARSDIRKTSSSGGAFSMIIESNCSSDDVVFGAAFSDDWKAVKHICCTGNDYERIKKSKYCFSDTHNTFSEVKKQLTAGKFVVFSGTPCQVSGLRVFLGNDCDNLLTIDFICHGVSSPKFYKDHLDYLSKGYAFTNVDLRPKDKDWTPYQSFSFVLDNKKTTLDEGHDLYLYAFFNNLSLRKCCYNCQYCNNNHQSDISLADFWGAGKLDPKLLKEPGVSLVICNTQKGLEAWSKVQAEMNNELKPEYFSYVFNRNSAKYDLNKREKFFARLKIKGLKRLEHEFRTKCICRDILHNTKKIIKKILN